ncbi:MAG: stringent starvation protein B [Gammaproteobacteria bacterium]|jgi:stringent starvation protein B
MTSNKPYLLRALNEWILDNGQTPHIIVDVNAEGMAVPEQAISDGKLVLNVAPQATRHLEMSNEAITFQARFSGKSYDIYLPIDAVMAIYARENGQGMMFASTKDDEQSGTLEKNPDSTSINKPLPGSHLKLIK